MDLKKAPRAAVIRRAAQAWNAGKPHTAWEIITTAGYGEPGWRAFQRVALRRARDRYQARLRRYTAPTR